MQMKTKDVRNNAAGDILFTYQQDIVNMLSGWPNKVSVHGVIIALFTVGKCLSWNIFQFNKNHTEYKKSVIHISQQSFFLTGQRREKQSFNILFLQ